MPEWFLTLWEIGLRILAWLTIPLMALSIYMMIRAIKKPHVVKVSGLVLQAVTPLIMLAVYALFLGVRPIGWLSVVLLLGGVGIGIARSRSTTFELKGDKVWGTRSGLYLIIWGVAFALTQTLVVWAPTSLAQYGYSTLYLGVGTALAVNLMLLFKRQQLVAGNAASVAAPTPPPAAAPVPPPAASPAGAVCQHCGAPGAPGAAFCPSCGQALEGQVR
jgi:hypothetical protein